MALPELIYAPIDGGTIHRYEISGGKRKFLRFIGCYLGQCNFHKNIDDAIDYIKNLKDSQKIQKHEIQIHRYRYDRDSIFSITT